MLAQPGLRTARLLPGGRGERAAGPWRCGRERGTHVPPRGAARSAPGGRCSAPPRASMREAARFARGRQRRARTRRIHVTREKIAAIMNINRLDWNQNTSLRQVAVLWCPRRWHCPCLLVAVPVGHRPPLPGCPTAPRPRSLLPAGLLAKLLGQQGPARPTGDVGHRGASARHVPEVSGGRVWPQPSRGPGRTPVPSSEAGRRQGGRVRLRAPGG